MKRLFQIGALLLGLAIPQAAHADCADLPTGLQLPVADISDGFDVWATCITDMIVKMNAVPVSSEAVAISSQAFQDQIDALNLSTAALELSKVNRAGFDGITGPLTIVGSSLTVGGNSIVGGSMTASSFWGDGSNLTGVVGSGINNIVEDTTPQLGGDLDGLDNQLQNVSTLTVNGSGSIGSTFTVQGTLFGGVPVLSVGDGRVAIGNDLDFTSAALDINDNGSGVGINLDAGITINFGGDQFNAFERFGSTELHVGAGLGWSAIGFGPSTMTITNGRVGVGNTNPAEAFDVVGNIAVSGTVDNVDIAARDHAATTSGDITHDSTIGGTTDDAHFDHADNLAELNAQISASIADGPHTTDASDLTSGTLPNARLSSDGVTLDTMTITGDAFSVGSATLSVSNGRVGIGTTSPERPFHIVVGDEFPVIIERNSANSAGPLVSFRKSRGTPGSLADVLDGDFAGNFTGEGYFGGAYRNVVNIRFKVDGTPSGSNVPGRIEFHVTTEGGAFDEKMRLDNVGNLGIGTTSATEKLDVNGNIVGNASSTASAFFGDGSNLTGISVGIFNIVEDVTPELGGDLDGLDNAIASVSTITVNGRLDLKGGANNDPPIMFDGATDVGIYKDGTSLGMLAGSSPVLTVSPNAVAMARSLQIDNSGAFAYSMRVEQDTFTITGGNVGIGETSPSALLTINHDSSVFEDALLHITDDDNDGGKTRIQYLRNTPLNSDFLRLGNNHAIDLSAGIQFNADDLTHGSVSLSLRAGAADASNFQVQIASTSIGNPVAVTTPFTVIRTGVGISVSNPARALHISDVMRIEPRSAAPSSPALGDVYVDSDSSEFCFYDGSSWTGLKAAGACS